MKDAGSFFEDEPVVIDASAIDAPVDWDTLVAALREHKLHPVGIIAHPDHADNAIDSGLPHVELSNPPARPQAQAAPDKEESDCHGAYSCSDLRQGWRGKDHHQRQFCFRPRAARPQDGGHRLRRRPAQPRSDHGLRTPRGVRLRQRGPRRSNPQAGPDQGQAAREPVRAGRLPDPRQGRADPRRRGESTGRAQGHGF
uniref:MinC_N domain-containing protein n=1 Tax=Parastrongyloides trichosuri TaxID=131310 RepID=A0A0N5A6V9_PARTI